MSVSVLQMIWMGVDLLTVTLLFLQQLLRSLSEEQQGKRKLREPLQTKWKNPSHASSARTCCMTVSGQSNVHKSTLTPEWTWALIINHLKGWFTQKWIEGEVNDDIIFVFVWTIPLRRILKRCVEAEFDCIFNSWCVYLVQSSALHAYVLRCLLFWLDGAFLPLPHLPMSCGEDP